MFSVSGFNEEGGRKDIKVKKYLEEGLLLLVATWGLRSLPGLQADKKKISNKYLNNQINKAVEHMRSQ